MTIGDVEMAIKDSIKNALADPYGLRNNAKKRQTERRDKKLSFYKLDKQPCKDDRKGYSF